MTPRLAGLSPWSAEVSTHLPHLSKRQVMGLATYSLGMVLAQSSGLSVVVYMLSLLLGQSENTVRQRLREVIYEAEAKRGAKRRAIEVEKCFGPLLKWIVSWWGGGEKRIALAMDASNLGERFTVLAISVMYRGCALPVAWAVLPEGVKGAWMPHWERLLRRLRGAIPEDWQVVVLADRGLYSKRLYRAIQRNGWHPMMRVKQQTLFRPEGKSRFRPLNKMLERPNSIWYGRGECFKTPEARLACTVLAHWDAGFAEPWLLVTDLEPEGADSLWYAMRNWIEQGFKDAKRGGFRWEQTKMVHPQRVARLWLVMALATLLLLSVGGDEEHHASPSGLADASADEEHAASPDASPADELPPGRATRPRRLSVLKRGWLTLLAHLIRYGELRIGRFWPEPWPRLPFVRQFLEPFWRGGHVFLY